MQTCLLGGFWQILWWPQWRTIKFRHWAASQDRGESNYNRVDPDHNVQPRPTPRRNSRRTARKVKALDDEIVDLCLPTWAADLPKSEGSADDYRLLVNEIMRLMLDRQLFTFVTTAAATAPSGVTMPAPGTNNEAERTLRNPAGARDTGRTTKTPRGARRRTVNVSVLESLRQHLATFSPAVCHDILEFSARVSAILGPDWPGIASFSAPLPGSFVAMRMVAWAPYIAHGADTITAFGITFRPLGTSAGPSGRASPDRPLAAG
jgi:hypothetical protein